MTFILKASDHEVCCFIKRLYVMTWSIKISKESAFNDSDYKNRLDLCGSFGRALKESGGRTKRRQLSSTTLLLLPARLFSSWRSS